MTFLQSITHATQQLMQSMKVYLIPSPEMEIHIPGLSRPTSSELDKWLKHLLLVHRIWAWDWHQ